MANAEGRIGIEPPPGAPVETSKPFDDGDRQAMMRAALEKRAISGKEPAELAPLTYGKTVDPGAELGNHEPREPEPVKAAPGYEAPTAPRVAAPRADMPAASDSDSPSRGLPGTAPVPESRSKAPMQVVGGFGMGEAEYFALNGSEVQTVARALLDEVNDIIANDLRFHLSQTYPNAHIRLTLRIESENDKPLIVERFRRETNDKGQVDMPPDAIRAEFGMQRPYKRVAPGPSKQVVDFQW